MDYSGRKNHSPFFICLTHLYKKRAKLTFSIKIIEMLYTITIGADIDEILLNILVSGNHDSGKMETGLLVDENQLNSA